MIPFVTEQFFYNGEVKLIYDDALHAYYTEEQGIRYLVPSATGVCGMIDKSGPLMPWAAKMVVEYINSKVWHLREGNTAPDSFNLADVNFVGVRTTHEWEQFLLDAKKNFRTISETALDIGTLAHDWLEAYTQAMIDNVAYNAPLPANEKACKAITSALDWHKAHNFRPIAAEKKVYSKPHNCAGTFDWVAYIDSCDNPLCCKKSFKDRRALGDYKSSKAIYDEYKIQTSFYKFALDDEMCYDKITPFLNGEYIEIRVILRLGKEDGEFSSLILTDREEYEADLNAFEGALSIYNWKQQMAIDKKEEKYQTKLVKVKNKVKKIKLPKLQLIEVVDS